MKRRQKKPRKAHRVPFGRFRKNRGVSVASERSLLDRTVWRKTSISRSLEQGMLQHPIIAPMAMNTSQPKMKQKIARRKREPSAQPIAIKLVEPSPTTAFITNIDPKAELTRKRNRTLYIREREKAIAREEAIPVKWSQASLRLYRQDIKRQRERQQIHLKASTKTHKSGKLHPTRNSVDISEPSLPVEQNKQHSPSFSISIPLLSIDPSKPYLRVLPESYYPSIIESSGHSQHNWTHHFEITPTPNMLLNFLLQHSPNICFSPNCLVIVGNSNFHSQSKSSEAKLPSLIPIFSLLLSTTSHLVRLGFKTQAIMVESILLNWCADCPEISSASLYHLDPRDIKLVSPSFIDDKNQLLNIANSIDSLPTYQNDLQINTRHALVKCLVFAGDLLSQHVLRNKNHLRLYEIVDRSFKAKTGQQDGGRYIIAPFESQLLHLLWNAYKVFKRITAHRKAARMLGHGKRSKNRMRNAAHHQSTSSTFQQRPDRPASSSSKASHRFPVNSDRFVSASVIKHLQDGLKSIDHALMCAALQQDNSVEIILSLVWGAYTAFCKGFERPVPRKNHTFQAELSSQFSDQFSHYKAEIINCLDTLIKQCTTTLHCFHSHLMVCSNLKHLKEVYSVFVSSIAHPSPSRDIQERADFKSVDRDANICIQSGSDAELVSSLCSRWNCRGADLRDMILLRGFARRILIKGGEFKASAGTKFGPSHHTVSEILRTTVRVIEGTRINGYSKNLLLALEWFHSEWQLEKQAVLPAGSIPRLELDDFKSDLEILVGSRPLESRQFPTSKEPSVAVNHHDVTPQSGNGILGIKLALKSKPLSLPDKSHSRSRFDQHSYVTKEPNDLPQLKIDEMRLEFRDFGTVHSKSNDLGFNLVGADSMTGDLEAGVSELKDTHFPSLHVILPSPHASRDTMDLDNCPQNDHHRDDSLSIVSKTASFRGNITDVQRLSKKKQNNQSSTAQSGETNDIVDIQCRSPGSATISKSFENRACQTKKFCQERTVLTTKDSLEELNNFFVQYSDSGENASTLDDDSDLEILADLQILDDSNSARDPNKTVQAKEILRESSSNLVNASEPCGAIEQQIFLGTLQKDQSVNSFLSPAVPSCSVDRCRPNELSYESEADFDSCSRSRRSTDTGETERTRTSQSALLGKGMAIANKMHTVQSAPTLFQSLDGSERKSEDVSSTHVTPIVAARTSDSDSGSQNEFSGLDLPLWLRPNPAHHHGVLRFNSDTPWSLGLSTSPAQANKSPKLIKHRKKQNKTSDIKALTAGSEDSFDSPFNNMDRAGHYLHGPIDNAPSEKTNVVASSSIIPKPYVSLDVQNAQQHSGLQHISGWVDTSADYVPPVRSTTLAKEVQKRLNKERARRIKAKEKIKAELTAIKQTGGMTKSERIENELKHKLFLRDKANAARHRSFAQRKHARRGWLRKLANLPDCQRELNEQVKLPIPDSGRSHSLDKRNSATEQEVSTPSVEAHQQRVSAIDIHSQDIVTNTSLDIHISQENSKDDEEATKIHPLESALKIDSKSPTLVISDVKVGTETPNSINGGEELKSYSMATFPDHSWGFSVNVEEKSPDHVPSVLLNSSIELKTNSQPLAGFHTARNLVGHAAQLIGYHGQMTNAPLVPSSNTQIFERKSQFMQKFDFQKFWDQATQVANQAAAKEQALAKLAYESSNLTEYPDWMQVQAVKRVPLPSESVLRTSSSSSSILQDSAQHDVIAINNRVDIRPRLLSPKLVPNHSKTPYMHRKETLGLIGDSKAMKFPLPLKKSLSASLLDAPATSKTPNLSLSKCHSIQGDAMFRSYLSSNHNPPFPMRSTSSPAELKLRPIKYTAMSDAVSQMRQSSYQYPTHSISCEQEHVASMTNTNAPSKREPTMRLDFPYINSENPTNPFGSAKLRYFAQPSARVSALENTRHFTEEHFCQIFRQSQLAQNPRMFPLTPSASNISAETGQRSAAVSPYLRDHGAKTLCLDLQHLHATTDQSIHSTKTYDPHPVHADRDNGPNLQRQQEQQEKQQHLSTPKKRALSHVRSNCPPVPSVASRRPIPVGPTFCLNKNRLEMAVKLISRSIPSVQLPEVERLNTRMLYE